MPKSSLGSYGFAGLYNGNYTLTPSKTGYTFTPSSISVTVSGANVTRNFTATTGGGGGTYYIYGVAETGGIPVCTGMAETSETLFQQPANGSRSETRNQ